METRQFVLGEVCTLRAGSAFKKEHQGLTDGDFPFIKVSDMNLPSNQFRIQEANNWVSRDIATVIGAKPFPAGTVVFAKIGEALKQNRVRLLTVPTFIDNNMMGAIPNVGLVQPRYLMLCLSMIGLDRWATGTAMPYLTQGTLNGVPVELPDTRTQRKIAAIVAAYDELIENNLRRIEILEEMAQAVYREWFVNFRFPGHEDVAMVDSPLGPIPEGWEVRPLGQLATFKSGGSTTKASFVAEGFAAFSASGPDGRLPYFEVDGDGVVISAVGANCGRIWLAGGRWSAIANTIRFLPISGIPAPYLFLATNNNPWPKRGSAQPFVSINDCRAHPVIEPSRGVLQQFEAHVAAMFGLVRVLREQNENLRATRDLLLPRLVSGEIDVSDLDIDTGWLES